MKIIFAGTPEFAATALKGLIESEHEVCLVLTQPDRASGRGMKLTPSAVKTLALAHDIPVATPVTLSLKKGGEEALFPFIAALLPAAELESDALSETAPDATDLDSMIFSEPPDDVPAALAFPVFFITMSA